MDFTLRRTTDRDLDFLFDLHRASFREYVEATWGVWDETDQRKRYLTTFVDPGQLEVVVVEGRDAGVLVRQPDSTEFAKEFGLGEGERSDFIELLEVAPEFRGQGLGTSIVWDLQGAAAAASRPLTLNVLRANPRAKALYERLAFRVTVEHDIRFFMRWDPVDVGGSALRTP